MALPHALRSRVRGRFWILERTIWSLAWLDPRCLGCVEGCPQWSGHSKRGCQNHWRWVYLGNWLEWGRHSGTEGEAIAWDVSIQYRSAWIWVPVTLCFWSTLCQVPAPHWSYRLLALAWPRFSYCNDLWNEPANEIFLYLSVFQFFFLKKNI